jgi:hypothetical protein
MRFGRDENRNEYFDFCGIESLRLLEAHPSPGGRDQTLRGVSALSAIRPKPPAKRNSRSGIDPTKYSAT